MLTWKSTVSPTTVQVVMIISDQPDTTRLWETLFKEKGFITVREAHQNAFQTCKIVDPALVVIDTHLPHTQRLEFCTKLRSIVTGPILLLVPDYNGNQMIDIYNIGVDECLLKPVNPAFLVVKGITWLFRKRWLESDPGLSQVYLNA